jgi:Zn-dependent protease
MRERSPIRSGLGCARSGLRRAAAAWRAGTRALSPARSGTSALLWMPALVGMPALWALQGRDKDPVEVGLVIAFLVLSLALHEVAHGWVALLRGDPTARDLGRLSLNPIVHIDPIWTLVVPLVTYWTSGFIFGGARPVPVNYFRLRHPLRDMALVAIAGPATNLLLGLLFMVAWKAAVFAGPYEATQLLPRVLYQVAFFNVLLAVFNLIPIPPLDGSRVMAWLLPPGLRTTYVGLEQIGMVIIVGLVLFVRPFKLFLFTGIDATWNLLNTLSGGVW